MKAVALIDGEHAPDVVREALRELPYEWVGRDPGGRDREAPRGRRLRRAARRGFDGRRGARRPLGRAGDLGRRPPPLGLACARGGALLRRRRLPLRPAAVRAVRAAVDRRDRHRQARRQDRRLGAPGAAPRPRPRRRRRDDGPGRAARARARRVAARRRRRSSRSRAPAVTPPPTTSRSRPSPACPTIGCRRAGGGLAGRPFVSNVPDGARLAAARAPDVVVFDGSGTAIPPVAVDRRVLVVGPGHDLERGLRPLPPPDLRPRRRRRLRASRRVRRASCACGRSGRSPVASPCSPPGPRRDRPPRAPRSSTSRSSLGDRVDAPARARVARRRHLPHRAEGRRDRPRRRARARARAAGRAGRERRQSRRGSTRRCSRSCRERSVTEPR